MSFRSFGFHGAALLVRPGHPLLSDETLDIAGFPIIAAGPIGGNRDELYKGLVEFYHNKPQMTVESTEALARLAETSDAIWMSSTFAAAHELARGSLVPLHSSEFGQGHQIEIGMFTLRHKTLSPLVEDIARRLKLLFNGETTERTTTIGGDP